MLNLGPAKERVALVLNVHDGALFLKRVLESIALQVLPEGMDLLVVAIDDASSDSSADLLRTWVEACQSCSGRIQWQLCLLDRNEGRAAARNRGVRIARKHHACWITFLDQDDWLPDQSLLQRLQHRGQATWIHGLQSFHLDASQRPSWCRQEWLDQPQRGGVLGASLFPLRLFDWIGEFQSDRRYGTDDLEWFARLRRFGFSERALDVVVLHRGIHETNGSANPRLAGELITLVRDRLIQRQQPSLPPVGVVIPVFQHTQYLAEALASAMNQTLPPAEIVVVDDGSEQPVQLPPLQELGERDSDLPCRLHRLPSNQGLSMARNIGVSLLSSEVEWVAFLDADDTWPVDRLIGLMLEASVAAASAVFGSMVSMDAEGNSGSAIPLPSRMPTAGVISRKAFESIGGFDPGVRFGQPIDLISRLEASGATCSNAPLLSLRRRIHAHNMSRGVGADPQGYRLVVRQHLRRRHDVQA